VKIYSIQNDFLPKDNIVGYLFYYASDRSFCIELKEGLPPQDMTLYFAAFAEKNIWTLNPSWSRRWVEQRIVPTDRQNLGMTLREAGLKEYDSHRLIVLSGGQCAQDDLSISPVSSEHLESWAKERLGKRISMAVPVSKNRLFAALYNKSVYIVELNKLINDNHSLHDKLHERTISRTVKLITGGTGITWSEGAYIMSDDLISAGKRCSFDSDDLRTVIMDTVLDTADVCEEYGVSRQYINRLTRDGMLPGISKRGRSQLYLRPDAEKLLRS